MTGRRVILLAATLLAAGVSSAQEAAPQTQPASSLPRMGEVLTAIEQASAPTPGGDGRDWSGPVKLAVVFIALALLPSVLVMMTSFTRIIIVLSFVRRALTTQNIPPTVALIGLALFLTIFTMSPTVARINEQALQPYNARQIDFSQAVGRANGLLKEFMLRQTRPADLELFVGLAGIETPATVEAVPMHVAIPSFAISEFRTAFWMGCLLFIPFLLIDLVVAGILLSTGMMMLPPVIVSLPFKIILFILVDGWSLLAKALVKSFFY
ncbi:MAG TPA: flagellar type III secretion system pore protein FliP [Phycisphaerae bacterium]|nr:flagellar type III secretion system pore protein FliP [Phycisphaerae bacterium]